jgi:hypothetical protein
VIPDVLRNVAVSPSSVKMSEKKDISTLEDETTDTVLQNIKNKLSSGAAPHPKITEAPTAPLQKPKYLQGPCCNRAIKKHQSS